MQFALINGIRVLPQKGRHGICPACNAVVIAKCGEFNVHHWAHKNLKHCDSWWERETEWHKEWKDKFPQECQEVVLQDTSSLEKHIADVLTTQNNVIEFQHSPIRPEEVEARERFYMQSNRKMVWVVDGNTGLNRQHFNLFRPNVEYLEEDVLFKWYSRSRLFEKWKSSKAYVLFDFDDGVLWFLKSYDSATKTVCVNPRSVETFLKKI